MKNGKFAAFVLMAVALASSSGCIITSDDDDVDVGVFHATWLVDGTTNPAACAPTEKVVYDFVETTAPFDRFIELFDCFDFAGDTSPIPPVEYTYVAKLMNCPSTEAGCPGGTEVVRSDTFVDDFFSCNDISDGVCWVDLPTFDFRP